MSHLVAVYGSLRKGLHNHVVLQGSPHITDGIVKGFGMYSLGAYPALSTEGVHIDVVVEVYEVTDKVLYDLDGLEGYPSYYNRKQALIKTPTGTKKAWVYYIKGRLDGTFVESGDWVKYLEGL